jgi:hypothetical protein
MVAKINADTAGGLKITSDTSGTLEIQSAGTTKFTVNSAGVDIPAIGTIDGLTSINSGQLAGNRNLILNGDFTLWQRGTSQSALTAAGTYLADRWTHSNHQTALHTRQAFAASGTHPANSQYVLRASGDGTSTASRIVTSQGVESVNCIPLRGKTITMSLYLRCAAATMTASGLGNLNILVGGTSATADAALATSAYDAGGSTNSAIAQGSLPTTWTKITATYTVPTNTNNLIAYVGFTNEVNAGTGDWYEISQVQVEIGSTATPFEQRGIGTELALCQRYYEILGRDLTTYTFNLVNMPTKVAFATTFGQGHAYHTVKRAAPTVVLFSRNNTSGKVSLVSNGADEGNNWAINAGGTVAFHLVQRDAGTHTVGIGIEYGFTADAEL